jgi:hypothetical protein
MKKKYIYALMLNFLLVDACMAQPVQPVSIKQNEVFCSSNPSSVFCIKEESTPTSEGNTDPFIEQLILANKTIKARFFYMKEYEDVWTSFGERFVRNRSFTMKGDCEDLTMTTIEYAIHSGIPKNRLARAIVIYYPLSSKGNFRSMELHMVAVYHSVETNRFYYFGDTLSKGVVVTTTSSYEPILIDWLTDNHSWIVANRIDRSS